MFLHPLEEPSYTHTHRKKEKEGNPASDFLGDVRRSLCVLDCGDEMR